MKQKTTQLVSLRDLMPSNEGWGNEQGRGLYLKLLDFVESHSGQHIFGLSLDRITKTDMSFARESVVELAKRFRGENGFYLCSLEDLDLMDNWDAAARMREQPIFFWNDDRYGILGPKPGESSMEPLKYVLSKGPVTVSEVAKRLRQPINSVSNKLKQLVDAGYLLRKEQVAVTGGIEFMYYPIR